VASLKNTKSFWKDFTRPQD